MIPTGINILIFVDQHTFGYLNEIKEQHSLRIVDEFRNQIGGFIINRD